MNRRLSNPILAVLALSLLAPAACGKKAEAPAPSPAATAEPGPAAEPAPPGGPSPRRRRRPLRRTRRPRWRSWATSGSRRTRSQRS
ncbi:MAG: hypothetical protein H6745_01510 [Deltaproteobacteria bacterium]|nr:hypothetical protein [Deltaproteobacteria bacterium]